MIADMAALCEHLGAEAPAIAYHIDCGSPAYFADAIMDPDPRFRVSEPDERDRPGGTVAPPTFFGGAVGLRDVPAGDPRTMSALNLPLPAGWTRLATGDEFEFRIPIRTGMTLYARERFIEAYEKQGRSGRLIFYTIEKTFSLPTGESALRRVLHCVAREPKPAMHGGPPRPRTFDSPSAGTALPSLTVGPVTVRYLAMFATATAEFVDIHYDADYARSVGLPGPIIQGLYKTSLVARMLKDWTGDGTLIRSIDVQHRGMDLAGSTLTVGGVIAAPPTEDSHPVSECHVWVRNQHGVVTTMGTARVARPSCGTDAMRNHVSSNDTKEHRQQ
jgi:acyl dehydratase